MTETQPLWHKGERENGEVAEGVDGDGDKQVTLHFISDGEEKPPCYLRDGNGMIHGMDKHK